ncbi:hypothetical protein D3C72_1541310 [compost metagenome]
MAQRLLGEELERGQVQLVAVDVENIHDVGELRHRQHHHRQLRRRPRQPQRGLDDEAERTLRADEQVAEVIAGIVLGQTVVQFQHLALAGHHLQPDHPFAGHAVAHDLDASGVGGDIAADLAAAAGGKIHRVVQAVGQRVLLQRLGDHPRLAAHGAANLVQLQDRVHALERHHQLAVARHRAAGQAGAAAGRHQRELLALRPAHQRHHFVHRFREQHRGGVGREIARPVQAVARKGIGIGGHAVGGQQAAQFGQLLRCKHVRSL